MAEHDKADSDPSPPAYEHGDAIDNQSPPTYDNTRAERNPNYQLKATADNESTGQAHPVAEDQSTGLTSTATEKAPASYTDATAGDMRQEVLAIAARDEALWARDKAVTEHISSVAVMNQLCEQYQQVVADFRPALEETMREFVKQRRASEWGPWYLHQREDTGYVEAYRSLKYIAECRHSIGEEGKAPSKFAFHMVAIVYDRLAKDSENRQDKLEHRAETIVKANKHRDLAIQAWHEASRAQGRLP